jgi:glycosyltransferase involved in cell wall biosynthesis
MSNLPFVSCLTPTFERRNFLPILLDIFQRQTYPENKRELIILDDSAKSNEDIIVGFQKKFPTVQIKYHYSQERIALGKKRNMLNDLATGEYIVYMDDDDYYPSDKIKFTIMRMIAQKSKFSGSSELHIYFTDTKQIYRFNKLGQNHSTAGTFCFHRDYLQSHKFEDDAMKSEERVFLDEYKTQQIQIDPFKSILCIAHFKNTFDKRNLIGRLVKTNLKLKNFVSEKHLVQFYESIDTTKPETIVS